MKKNFLILILLMFGITTNAQYLLKAGNLQTPFIDYNGKLGIGTIIPGAALHIKGNFTAQPFLKIEANNSVGSISYMFNNNGYNYALYQDSPDGSSFLNYFKDPILIKNLSIYGSDGNGAGIQTDRGVGAINFKMTPQSGPVNIPLSIYPNQVDVSDLLSTKNLRISNGAGLNKILVSDDFGNAQWTDMSISLPNFWQESSLNNNWLYTRHLRVGIRTDSPSEVLEVSHNDSTGGIAINQEGHNSLYKSEIKFKLQGKEEWAIGSTTEYPQNLWPEQDDRKCFWIWNHVSQKMALWINGRTGQTGIGTGWPAAMLDVNGNFKTTAIGVGMNPPTGNTFYKVWVNGGIAAREVKVTVQDFPDYVFEDNYPLISIQEYGKYISTNRHLPGFPTKDEVSKSDGVELGSMQTKLLEKIEEQALYIIQLQKQIDELKHLITTVKENKK